MWRLVSFKAKESKLQALLLSLVASKNTAVADCRVQPKTSFLLKPIQVASEHRCQFNGYFWGESTYFVTVDITVFWPDFLMLKDTYVG